MLIVTGLVFKRRAWDLWFGAQGFCFRAGFGLSGWFIGYAHGGISSGASGEAGGLAVSIAGCDFGF